MKLYMIHIAACQLVGMAGALFTFRSLREWYPTLHRPSFSPPNWIFGPVWTTLYLMIAIAGARVYGDSVLYPLWVLQLVLNAVWSPIFFGLRRLDLALIDIVALWCSIALCVHQFPQISPLASWLFLPYWAWVSFATLLNFEFWRLNRKTNNTL